MIEVSQKEFEELVARGIDNLPDRILKELDNVAIVTADCPDEIQRRKAKLPPIRQDQSCRHGWLLFGLYEGIPKTRRGSNYSLVLPDKITIFKEPIQAVSNTMEEMEAQVTKTVWHEVAHHFGLGHPEMHAIEKNQKQQ